MTPRESERRARIRHEHASDDNLVLSFREWCTINSISARTGARILAGPNGPVVTRMGARKIGITRKNNATWQAARSAS